jgi:mannosyltransferase OCH1-like enzyme
MFYPVSHAQSKSMQNWYFFIIQIKLTVINKDMKNENLIEFKTTTTMGISKLSGLFDIRGSDLLDSNYNPGTFNSESGKGIPKIIHQTWKSEDLLESQIPYTESWKKFHPEFLHVLWTDEDNNKLVTERYPQYLEVYNSFPLVIEQIDFVRLLYLLEFGGIYADTDYVAYDNIIKHLSNNDSDIYIGESTHIKNEIFQNALMISTKNCIFIQSVLDNIIKIVYDIENDTFYKEFKHPYTNKLSHLINTINITGPRVIDKTIVKDKIDGVKKYKLTKLPKEQFQTGNVAAHMEHGTWISSDKIFKHSSEIISIAVIALVFLLSITFMVSRRYFSKCKTYKR